MEVLVLFIARYLIAELFGVNEYLIILLAFLVVISNFHISKFDFFKISSEHTLYFIGLSLLLVVALFNQDVDSIGNILTLYMLPFIPIKSIKYSKFIIPFVIFISITYCILIINNFSIYQNRSFNYLLIGRGLLVSQVLILFSEKDTFRFLKIPISLILLVGLSIMHGRLNAILSFLLILIYLLKQYKNSWIFIVTSFSFFSIIVSYLSNIKTGTIKRLLNDQASITNRGDLVITAFSELQNIKTLIFGGGLNFSKDLAYRLYGYPYLHNLPLELLLDYGFFSLPILFIWISKLISSGKNIWYNKDIILPILLFIESFQFLKSFEFNQSISLFLIITLITNKKNEL